MANPSYQGIFVRDQLGQVPSSNTGAWSSSPDIILAGKVAVPDPNTFTTPSGYSTDYGATLYINEVNYIYLRGMSTVPTTWQARMWFYHTVSDLALWPQNWKGDDIWFGGNQQNWCMVNATSANQVVVNGPMQWIPTPPGSGHYCLILWAENQPVSNPAVNPVPQTSMGTWQDLAAFVLSHPNMGWRNTYDVSSLGATWTATVPITGPEEDSEVNVGYQCTNMPTDGFVSVNMPGPGGVNIKIDKTPILHPNQGFTVRYPDWPGHFNTQMTLQFYQGATKPPPYSGITPTLTTPATSKLDAIAMQHGRMAHIVELFDAGTLVRRGPTKVYTIGAMPLIYYK